MHIIGTGMLRADIVNTHSLHAKAKLDFICEAQINIFICLCYYENIMVEGSVYTIFITFF